LSHDDSHAAARLTSLYEAHAADAFRYALHLTGRREDAEDVVQYVFLQAHSTLEAGRELVNPRAWLIKATKHRSLNLIRDRRDVPAADVHVAGNGADPGEAAALTEVRASLWSLPEPQHHAFVLRHWSGLSQDEIAEVMTTTPGAVESLLVRARATLVAEHEAGNPECAGVRERLVRMLSPTIAHEAHLAGCHRCRTAQARLLRAAGFAAALVPGPQVAHALAAAVPGFGASGAAAGTAAASAGGAGAGAGSGGAAVSTASVATKAGIMAKLAVVATTAAVAVTAVHPVRTALNHALLSAPAHRAAAATPRQPAGRAAHPASARATAPTGAATTTGAAGGAGGPGTAGIGAKGKGRGTASGAGGNGAGKGKSGTAGSNGSGQGGGTGVAKGAANGKSASAPGKTKAAGSKAATGNGHANGSSSSSSTPAGNGNGGGNGKGNAGTTSNAGGNGKGNGKP
jgi:RNA polymerase sigma factor (sigma-70 family)